MGRDTEWQQSSESEDDDDDDLGMNPLECTPTAIPAERFGEDATSIVQVAATDSATFALTTHGFVYGWGMFKVRSYDPVSGSSFTHTVRATKVRLVSQQKAFHGIPRHKRHPH